MPYIPSLDAAATDFEERAQCESLEVLHAERRKIQKERAPLELLFGSGGDRWTAKRRQHRDGVAKLILAELPKEEKQPSEAALERMANSDPRHQHFCEVNEDKYPRYVELTTMLTEVEDRIESRLVEGRFATAECRLTA